MVVPTWASTGALVSVGCAPARRTARQGHDRLRVELGSGPGSPTTLGYGSAILAAIPRTAADTTNSARTSGHMNRRYFS